MLRNPDSVERGDDDNDGGDVDQLLAWRGGGVAEARRGWLGCAEKQEAIVKRLRVRKCA